MKKLTLLLLAGFLLASCQKPSEPLIADIILYNGDVYTLDVEEAHAEAIAIRAGRILLAGTNEEALSFKGDSTETIDLKGAFVMPGFIEGHGHFSSLGSSLMNLNFMHARSWDEIVAMVAERAKTARPGEWITGRGWHQEKWEIPLDKEVQGYPYHDKLSAVSPDNPVLLGHASGHSLIANARAMEAAGITAETPNPFGGEIVRDSRGQAVGVFEETAMGLIHSAYEAYRATLSPEQVKEEWRKGIDLAQEECLRKGVTSFQDAGSSFQEIDDYTELAGSGRLGLRLWVMIAGSEEDLARKAAAFPRIGIGNNFLTVRAIKGYMDGALGSYGAWLLEPYSDKPDSYGQNTTPIDTLKQWAQIAYDNGLQFCVHAIGDRGNREVLNIFEEQFSKDPSKKSLRWRVEHAQHLHPDDIPRFAGLGVIASMQAIHCTSDAPFVEKRLGAWRSRAGAYAWRSLLDAGAHIANGTDTPVEDVDPLACYYAAVTRKRADDGSVFYPEQCMTREEALYAYTLGNAYAAFEEDVKGSLEKGKVADITVLSNNLISCPEEAILQADVLMTMVDGKVKFRSDKLK